MENLMYRLHRRRSHVFGAGGGETDYLSFGKKTSAEEGGNLNLVRFRSLYVVWKNGDYGMPVMDFQKDDM